jgi:energy-coupling factor transporter transmembrane protein EcfT
MASAMMSRGFGYDVDNRTELKPLRFRPVDWGVAASLAVFLVVGVLLGFVGVAKYTFTMSLLGMG